MNILVMVSVALVPRWWLKVIPVKLIVNKRVAGKVLKLPEVTFEWLRVEVWTSTRNNRQTNTDIIKYVKTVSECDEDDRKPFSDLTTESTTEKSKPATPTQVQQKIRLKLTNLVMRRTWLISHQHHFPQIQIQKIQSL